VEPVISTHVKGIHLFCSLPIDRRRPLIDPIPKSITLMSQQLDPELSKSLIRWSTVGNDPPSMSKKQTSRIQPHALHLPSDHTNSRYIQQQPIHFLLHTEIVHSSYPADIGVPLLPSPKPFSIDNSTTCHHRSHNTV
jgi:hypothetical protein